MIAEKSERGVNSQDLPPQPLAEKRRIPWTRLLISLILSGLGLWFVTRDASLADVRAALAQARPGYILLGVFIILVTTAAKSWRWRLLFHPREQAPPFASAFWALSLGQLVNTAIPFFRLGEIARVYNLDEHAGSSKARALGTLVVEKILDLIMLALTLFVLLPFVVIPSFVTDSGAVLAVVALVAFATLYGVAYKTELVVRAIQRLIQRLPAGIGKRLMPIIVSGLRGLSALRSRRTTLALLAVSVLIAFLSVLTPLVLFSAFNLPLGPVAAAAIHVVVSIGTVPPSTPAKVGIFEFLVGFMLGFFAVENRGVILAYTVIFHLVVVLPQIVLGGIAALRRSRGDRRRPWRLPLRP